MRYFGYLSMVLLFFLVACDESKDYYPEKSADLSETKYKRFKLKLDTAYSNNDYFEVGIQLANLKASSQKVYQSLNKGIELNSSKCVRIYDWYSIYDNFKNNLVRLDTNAFKKSYQLCLELRGPKSYLDYEENKIKDHQEKLAKREILDSTLFDLTLIKELEKIYYDDQNLRSKYDFDDLPESKSKELWRQVKILDSINLIKIEKLLSEKGYPTKEKVGYDKLIVPWLVLHHQSDLSVRNKYQKLVEENCGKGLIKTYKWRSENIRAENKTH